jgi:hypothetical protein
MDPVRMSESEIFQAADYNDGDFPFKADRTQQ